MTEWRRQLDRAVQRLRDRRAFWAGLAKSGRRYVAAPWCDVMPMMRIGRKTKAVVDATGAYYR